LKIALTPGPSPKEKNGRGEFSFLVVSHREARHCRRLVTTPLKIAPEAKAEIERQAEALAERLPPYQPKSETPAEYLPKHVAPASKSTLDERGIPVVVSFPEKR
jgi:hypothetical protein